MMKLSPLNIFSMLRFNVCLITALTVLLSCKKLVDVPAPSSSINIENAFDEDATAAAVINGLYTDMSNEELGNPHALLFPAVFAGLSADELEPDPSFNEDLLAYYRNSVSPNGVFNAFWQGAYRRIYTINTTISGLNKSVTLNPAVKRQLLGQAYFLRGLQYFYLTTLYGDVPLALSTDYEVNSRLSRAPQKAVFAQIISDLTEAKARVNAGYTASNALQPSDARTTPNQAAVEALLARVYLFNEDYAAADAEASLVISQDHLYNLKPLDEVFTANSGEAIWQLQPVSGTWNTQEGRIFILDNGAPDSDHPVFLQPALVNAFEAGDQRKVSWIAKTGNWYYAYKYKSGSANAPQTEYKMVLRLAETYLIRAEARARLNDISGAQSDLNAIRHRAGLEDTPAATTPELLQAIWKEHQVELFTENGDRWLTLKRSKTIDQAMKAVEAHKGITWDSNMQLYPINNGDLKLNANLTQNPGY